MTKQYLTLLLAVLMICGALSGCQLAIADADAAMTQDKFVGIYIVQEDSQSWLYGEDGTASKLDAEGRYYATKKPSTDPNHPVDVNYEFEGVEGIPFFLAYSSGGNGIYHKPFYGPELFNTLVGVGTHEQTISGEISVATSANSDDGSDVVLYIFNVYQTANDEIYMVQKNAGVGVSQYGSTAFTFSESSKIKEDGVELETKTSVRVSISESRNVQKYVFQQMDDQNTVIATTTITADNRPESIIRDKNAAYMIVEIHGLDNVNKETITREMVNQVKSIFQCKFLGDNRIDAAYPLEIK